jgi:GT2 family glycosyltransferase
MIDRPQLSVQIVTWNSAHVIGACLQSLAQQHSRSFEVVIVDNASIDQSVAVVERWRGELPALEVVCETHNRGFCGGQNRATARSRADWVLFLNPDTTLPPTFVGDAIAAAASAAPSVGAIAPCILLPDGTVDSTGLAMDRFRRAYDRDRRQGAERRHAADRDVFGCTGAVALLRRTMLEDVAVDGQVLDEQIFAYYDDLDLSWRATLRGWRCRYEPVLTAVHQRAARNAIRALPGRPIEPRDQQLSVRNRLLVMARCDRPVEFLVALPWLMAFEVARIGYLAWRAPAVLKAYREVFGQIGAALQARRTIHNRAAVAPPLPPLPWRVR